MLSYVHLSWALAAVAMSLLVSGLLSRKRHGGGPSGLRAGFWIALISAGIVAGMVWPGLVGAEDQPAAGTPPAPAAAAPAAPAEASPEATPAKPAEAKPVEAESAEASKAEQTAAEKPADEAAEESAPAAAKPTPAVSQDLRDNRWVKIAVIVATLVLPFVLGSFLSNRWRMPDYYGKITLVLFCFFVSLAITTMKWPPKLGIDLRGGVILVYEIQQDSKAAAPKAGDGKEQAQAASHSDEETAKLNMDKLVQAISRRINPGGVKEVTIRPQGANDIEIIIPEADEAETARIKSIISRAGTLEFRILANTRDHKSIIDRALASDADKLYDSQGKLLAWWVPITEGQEKSFASYGEIATRVKKVRGKERPEILVVKDPFDVTGDYLSSARTGIDQSGRPKVDFAFTATGGRLFGQLTQKNLPDKVQNFSRKLGIILDGYLYSAPAIQSTIHDQGEITGDFTKQETEDLVNVLNAGSLPSTLTEQPISELFTGPTLGQDTIERGMNAILLATALVIVFMLVYYRFSGMVACMALVLNMLMLMAAMIVIQAAFTLPGLAGLALTIGMAVDANVLIYERFREELDRQSSLRMAIRNGFSRAQSAIIDSNLTTLISAAVLYAVGTEQVKGFAVPLFLGVAINIFTAVFCAHVVFDIAEKQKWITHLKMMRLLTKTNIDFWGARHFCFAISGVVILIGMIAVFFRGASLLDIDFTGGVSVEVVLNEPQEVGEVRELLEKQDLQDLLVSDVYRKGEKPGQRFVINTATPPNTDANEYLAVVQGKLKEVFGDKLASNTLTFSDLEPAKTTAAGKDSPAGDWAQASLSFTHKIDHGTLLGILHTAAKAHGVSEEPLAIELSNAEYEPDDITPYAAWEVKLPVAPDKAKAILATAQEELHKVPVFPSAATIGGKVAGSTRIRGLYALGGSMILIVLYLWVRFQRVVFGVAAVMALVHDVLVTIGFLALSAFVAPYLGFLMITPFKIGLTELAAILTLVGYSVNDTVVIFDRVREVRGKSPYLTPEMINLSINQTFSRTILTALTVLIVVFVLYVLGGPTIHAFSFALLIGGVAGTFSSVYIAAPFLFLGQRKPAAAAKGSQAPQAS